MHAWVLRLRRVLRMLAIAHPSVLPSVTWHGVGTLAAIISQLNTLPACAPVNASMAALRPATHDSGPGWIATPFLYDSFIHYSTPVYPGALRSLLVKHYGFRAIPLAPGYKEGVPWVMQSGARLSPAELVVFRQVSRHLDKLGWINSGNWR